MSDATMTETRSAALTAVMKVGVAALALAAIYGVSVGAGKYLDARAVSEMRPAVAQLMVRDTVSTVIGAESDYMAGMMGTYAAGAETLSPEFRSLQREFGQVRAPSQYHLAGAAAQAETPLDEAGIITLARDVLERHAGLRDLLQTARSELSGTGLDRERRGDVAALLVMNRLTSAGALKVAPSIAERIRELTGEALSDPAVAGRADAIRTLVDAGLTRHLARSPSVAAEAVNLVNGAPGMDRLEIQSEMGQKHSVRLGPAGTYRNVAHAEVADPFAQGAQIRLGETGPSR